MNDIEIITNEDSVSIANLNMWYKDIGITNPGYEDLSWEVAYDGGAYIGKGPSGVYEFVQLLAEIVIELHETGFIKRTFKKELPIIIHDLEYVWYMVEATIKANPADLICDFKEYYL